VLTTPGAWKALPGHAMPFEGIRSLITSIFEAHPMVGPDSP
jgi:hypothetical protein